jgi:AcrR family transcriptional regulator
MRSDDGRLVRGRRSRARIRTAARELFAERGFDATTLRAIGERAGMGASSIYRHVRSKHELLVLELAELQEEAWLRFRRSDDKTAPTRARVQRFLDVQHELLASDGDLVVIALRATTYPEAPVARRALALQDRAIGLLTEILQSGRRDLAPGRRCARGEPRAVPRRERRADQLGERPALRIGVPTRGGRVGRPVVPGPQPDALIRLAGYGLRPNPPYDSANS